VGPLAHRHGFFATFVPAGPIPTIAILSAALSVLLLACSLLFVYRGTCPRTKGLGGPLVYFGSVAYRS
jgi:hypothetical protein